MCELVRDCVSVLHCVPVRHADSVSVWIGHALCDVDDLDDIVVVADRVVVVYHISLKRQERDGESVGLINDFAFALGKLMWDGVCLFHRVAVRHALSVSVCIGHAVTIGDALVDAV